MGVKFVVKKRYVTLEWPLSSFSRAKVAALYPLEIIKRSSNCYATFFLQLTHSEN